MYFAYISSVCCELLLSNRKTDWYDEVNKQTFETALMFVWNCITDTII
jgi:tryptophan-rich sensory protein